MRRTLIVFLLGALGALAAPDSIGQQLPFLSELFSRYEEFNRAVGDRRSGANSAAVESLRKRSEEAFRQGSIPGMLEALGEANAMIAGKKWDEKQRFIASLTLETDRLVIEPNQILQVSLTRMFPTNIEKAFSATPTVTFQIVAGEATAKPGEVPPPPALTEPLVIAERIAVAETSSNAARKLLLPDGAYNVVAKVESGGKSIAEFKRPVYAISDFKDSLAQMSRTLNSIKASVDPKIKALAPLVATPEFQHLRLAPLNRSRGDVDINPIKEIDRIEAELSALAKGRDPFTRERGEVERAYQAADGTLFPYRLYVPRNYDGETPKPLVVMLHGELGDERYYFSGMFDPQSLKAEADRRGWVLVGTNGRGRFGVSDEDVFEVVKSVTRDYKIDSSRIYLMGHAKGGFGAWLIAAKRPELFAAIAAISAGPPADGEALTALLSSLKGTSAIVVHGAADGITPAQLSRAMASAAEKAGLKVTLIEVPDGDHLSVVGTTLPAVMDFFEKSARPGAAK